MGCQHSTFSRFGLQTWGSGHFRASREKYLVSSKQIELWLKRIPGKRSETYCYRYGCQELNCRCVYLL